MGTIMPRGRIAAAGLALFCVWGAAPPARSEDSHAQNSAGNAETSTQKTEEIGISANPAATNEITGTGWLGRQLGVNKHGVRLGGLWVGGVNGLVSGGIDPGFTFNSSLVIDLYADLERFAGLKGSSIGFAFLQFNSQATNTDAGSVLGYIGLVSTEPFDRSELLEAWWRQELFDA